MRTSQQIGQGLGLGMQQAVTASQDKKPGAIDSSLQELEGVVVALSERLSRFVTRVDPVLRRDLNPLCPTDNQKEPESNIAMVQRLRTITRQATAALSLLEDADERLEL